MIEPTEEELLFIALKYGDLNNNLFWFEFTERSPFDFLIKYKYLEPRTGRTSPYFDCNGIKYSQTYRYWRNDILIVELAEYHRDKND